MSIPPSIVALARLGWRLQWSQLMNGLAPSDKEGNYSRKPSQARNAVALSKERLLSRSQDQFPTLIIGRSCPWAHRTWLLYELRNLKNSLNLVKVYPDHKAGLWKFDPSYLNCESLIELYKLCGINPSLRATVPALIDPGDQSQGGPKLLGNESAQLVEIMNEWPALENSPDFYPKNLQEEIDHWQSIIQESINNGVYKCGFARNQKAYETASEELFKALERIEIHLSSKDPWLCGQKLTLADIRLFPTMIRWEAVYANLFGCTQKPLSAFPSLIEWRKRFFEIPNVSKTCNVFSWRNDYFGALFPLNPSNIIPKGPTLEEIMDSY